MENVRFDCNCDTVLEMEDMGVGVEEILQYARAMLPREEILSLIHRLEELVAVPCAE